MIRTVFLDVDGVLADFTMGAHKKLGLSLDYNQWPYPKGPNGQRWESALGMTFNQLSALCDFNFWAALNWTADGPDLLRRILDVFDSERIVLLTTPMPHIMSASGKMAWIEKYLPEYSRSAIVCSAPKSVMARPDSLLIDDNQDNCANWMAAGGRAIMVPRCWNNLHHMQDEAPLYVQQQLDLYKQEG